MKTYTQAELNEILRNHEHWLLEDCDGWDNMRADLSRADLTWADLSGANLRTCAKWRQTMPQKAQIKRFSCCFSCPNRRPACSDRCADYMIAKAVYRAEGQWMRERWPGRRRNVNGRK